MHLIDFIIFFLFTGGIVLFGCSFFKKKISSEEFVSGGRNLPGWVVGMSIFSTYVSSISYLGYPGMAYAGNWNAFVFSLSIPVAALFAVMYFVPFYPIWAACRRTVISKSDSDCGQDYTLRLAICLLKWHALAQSCF